MSATDKRDNKDNPGAGVNLADLLELVRRGIEIDLRVALPAKVVTYDPEQQTAKLSIELLPVRYQGETEVPTSPILLPPTPVYWPGGSSGYVTTPLVPGDTGLVIFSDRALSLWLQKGITGDPVNGRTHDLADGVFFPGVRTIPGKIGTPTDLAATVVEGPLVKAGRDAVAPTGQIALAQALHTYLTALITAGVPGSPPDGGLNLKNTMLTYLGTNPFTAFATTKALAE